MIKILAGSSIAFFWVYGASAYAQLVEGGLKLAKTNTYQLSFTKSASAINDSSNSSGSGTADASATFIMTDGSTTVTSVDNSGTILKTKLSATGFTTNDNLSLGNSDISASITDSDVSATYSSYTVFTLTREASSSSSSFVDTFAKLAFQ